MWLRNWWESFWNNLVLKRHSVARKRILALFRISNVWVIHFCFYLCRLLNTEQALASWALHFWATDPILNVLDFSCQLTAVPDLIMRSYCHRHQVLSVLFIIIRWLFLLILIRASLQLALALLIPHGLVVEIKVDLMKLLKIFWARRIKLRCRAIRVLAVSKSERWCLSWTTSRRNWFFLLKLANQLLLLSQLVW